MNQISTVLETYHIQSISPPGPSKNFLEYTGVLPTEKCPQVANASMQVYGKNVGEIKDRDPVYSKYYCFTDSVNSEINKSPRVHPLEWDRQQI